MPAKKDDAERKDRVIQTRVNQSLDDALKAEAARRRLPVSSLIRNVLEDAMHLMGNVVDNVDAIAQDAIGLGRQARDDARRLAGRATHKSGGRRKEPSAATESSDDAPVDASAFEDVYAWQALTMNKKARCAARGEAIDKGDAAFMGLSDADGPRRFICKACHDAM